MSRSSIILLLILVAIVGAAIALSTMDSSVTPTRIEKAVVPNAPAQ